MIRRIRHWLRFGQRRAARRYQRDVGMARRPRDPYGTDSHPTLRKSGDRLP